MPNLRIVADDGIECTVTLLAMSNRVSSETFFRVLDELIATRRATATLNDGRTADIFLLGPTDGFHPLSEQASLPLREFEGDVLLLFELPGRIKVRASSDAEARRIVTDVVRNNRRNPPGFSVVLDGDAIDAFNNRLAASVADGHPNRTLGVTDIVLTNLVEQRLLDNVLPAQPPGASS